MERHTIFSGIAYYISKIDNKEPKRNPTRGPKDEYFDFDLIGYYFRNQVHPNALQVISDRTSNDMDFEELFMFLGRTRSKIGQQYLYKQLSVIAPKPDFETQEELIGDFTADTARLLKAEAFLSKLNDRNMYYLPHLFLEEYIPKPKRFWLFPVLSVAGLVSFFVVSFYPQGVLLVVTRIHNQSDYPFLE